MKRAPQKRPLVELHHVQLTLGGSKVLREVTWAVQQGEGWLVTGANGAGKTSLLRILAGRIWPDPGKRGGQRLYHFSRQATDSPIGLEGRMAWLSPETHQRFARLEPSPRAGDVILTGFANTFLLTHRPSPKQLSAARALAKKLGLASTWQRPFAELSQGRQRLVLLARALVSRPRLLVFDEFSDGLDHAGRTTIARVIGERLRKGVAVVVASHRVGDVLPGLTRHLTLNKGRAWEVPFPPQGRKLLRRIRIEEGPPAIIPSGAPVLYFTRANVSVGDHARIKRILHDINWTVRRGEHWAVMGPNGCGKSTLLRAIYGDLPVARGGALRRFGRSDIALPLPEARRRMGYVSPALQHHYAANLSVKEVAASGFQSTVGLLRAPTSAELARTRMVLRQLGLVRLAQRRWGELSFGEARLVLLARALAPKPRLLLLDEPCDGLAPKLRAKFLRLIERAARSGAQIIIAAHRDEDLPACINRVLRLQDGRIP